MKKILVGVLLLALATAVFADDALVLPKGVLRVYLTGAYAFFNQAFDVDGLKADPAGYDALSAINLGGAIEFGVLDWISAAVQWAPGWTVWSATDNGANVMGLDYANLTANGPYNVFAGAKVQIIGPDAPVRTRTTGPTSSPPRRPARRGRACTLTSRSGDWAHAGTSMSS
jgi:hypothetical protein